MPPKKLQKRTINRSASNSADNVNNNKKMAYPSRNQKQISKSQDKNQDKLNGSQKIQNSNKLNQKNKISKQISQESLKKNSKQLDSSKKSNSQKESSIIKQVEILKRNSSLQKTKIIDQKKSQNIRNQRGKSELQIQTDNFSVTKNEEENNKRVRKKPVSLYSPTLEATTRKNVSYKNLSVNKKKGIKNKGGIQIEGEIVVTPRKILGEKKSGKKIEKKKLEKVGGSAGRGRPRKIRDENEVKEKKKRGRPKLIQTDDEEEEEEESEIDEEFVQMEEERIKQGIERLEDDDLEINKYQQELEEQQKIKQMQQEQEEQQKQQQQLIQNGNMMEGEEKISQKDNQNLQVQIQSKKEEKPKRQYIKRSLLMPQKNIESSKKDSEGNIIFPKKLLAKELKPEEKINLIELREDIKDANIKRYLQCVEILQEWALPNEIPCRDEEKDKIYDFLQNAMQNEGSANSLYISGVPGIGKTASFLEVMRKITDEYGQSGFFFSHLNGMGFNQPENLYQQLLKEMIGLDTSKAMACNILNMIFTTGKLEENILEKIENKEQIKMAKQNLKLPKIVLLDELDYLYTNDQNLLYNLFDWPHHQKSKLILIGIANTMDFPEKLKHKIASRIGNERVVFQPYKSNQIQSIIQSRIENLESVFEDRALIHIAKKIATSSSDIRRTLNVCRRSVQLAMEIYQKQEENQELKKVTIENVQQAYKQLYDKPYHKCLKFFSEFHKILLISIALESKIRGNNKAFLNDTVDRARLMNSNLGNNYFPSLSEEELDPNKKQYNNVTDIQITLNLQLDDITNALINDKIFEKFRQLF
ncbi:P-loop containing nucleoside triphosphate hydrolase [Pseudocohnilembus persalinus]|uniref:Origin recognition complex subunit 1 n=1 Tax=Pseudocohnilembus persalinus TaxID=266149 RepID=A0A0V0QTJ5_PSEPJ|nr:P-loop containing nucleoside triphosphate hydrolase [Pseudocohnilembus persalinus]|eukprot:KRX05511.1 P-loop containing nucleoside triphosphate hydrolase [Pseudocohnilembus persalinus]